MKTVLGITQSKVGIGEIERETCDSPEVRKIDIWAVLRDVQFLAEAKKSEELTVVTMLVTPVLASPTSICTANA